MNIVDIIGLKSGSGARNPVTYVLFRVFFTITCQGNKRWGIFSTPAVIKRSVKLEISHWSLY